MTAKNSRKNIKDKNRLEGLNCEALRQLVNSEKEYSYVQFCPMIGIQKQSGNSKEKQLKDLNAICEIKKHGTKYQFVRMRTPDEIVLYTERAKYLPFIANILIEIILERMRSDKYGNKIYYLTTTQILHSLGMVNQNFLLFQSDRHKWEYKQIAVKNHKDDFTIKEINTFMYTTYSDILKPIVRNAFKSIDDHYGVVIQRAYKCFTKYNDETIVQNFLATSKIGIEIGEIAGKALEMVGVESMSQLFKQKKNVIEEYYKICNVLCKEHLGFDKFCQCYAISIHEERLNKIYNWSQHVMKKELNKRTIEKIRNADIKKFKDMTIKGRDNLINAVIEIDTSYNFKQELNKGKCDE